jgi:hypothetical protein
MLSIAQSNRRRLLAAVVAVGAGSAVAAGLAAPAAAAPSAGTHRVVVTIKQNGNYTATICVNDNLQGSCQAGLRKGAVARFVQNPGRGEPISVRVVVPGAPSAFADVVTDGDALRFETRGDAARPVIVRR